MHPAKTRTAQALWRHGASCFALKEELLRQGHDVTLLASGDSRPSAKLVRCCEMALRFDRSVRDGLPYHMIMLDDVRRRIDQFDVLHFHIDLLPAPVVRDIADRTLTSLHGQLDLPDLAPFYGVFRELPLAPISYDQLRYLRNVNWFGTIDHGLSRSTNDQRFTPKIARPGSGLSV